MDDEGLTHLTNFCTDLVTLKRWEAFPTHLLMGKRTGEWARVRELSLQAGLEGLDVKAKLEGLEVKDLFAAWLPDPSGNEGYAVILFYDEESLWTMAASYNRQRLLEGVLPNVPVNEAV